MNVLRTIAVSLVLAGGALAAPQYALASTNFALSSSGASFVSGSSIIDANAFGLTINQAIMRSNLLTDTPVAAINNGDPRYIFGDNDPNGTVEIDLGQLRRIFSLGATIQTPSMGDRYVLGPFSTTVSADGVTFSAFGAPVTIDGATANPVSIGAPTELVRYVRYSFGDTGARFGTGGGGSAIYQVFATGAVPEPTAWVLMIAGVGMAGGMLRRHRAAAALA